MEKHTEQLSEQVKDALTELGNIGAGNATTSLSVLLSSKLSMSAPTVKLYDFNELENALGGPETSVVGVLSRLHGSFNAMILFVLGLDDPRCCLDRHRTGTARWECLRLEKSRTS